MDWRYPSKDLRRRNKGERLQATDPFLDWVDAEREILKEILCQDQEDIGQF